MRINVKSICWEIRCVSSCQNDPTFNQNFATYYDECFNTTSWDIRSSGAASDCKGILVDTAHPGVIELVTGTDTGGKASALYSYIGSNVPQWLPGSNIFYYETYIDILNLATVGDDYDYYVGPSDGWMFGSPGNGIYFRYNRATSVNWLAVAKNADCRGKLISPVEATLITFVVPKAVDAAITNASESLLSMPTE